MRNLMLTFVLGLMAIAIQAQQMYPLEVNGTAQLEIIPEGDAYTRVLVSDIDGVIHRRELSTMGDGLGNHVAAQSITVYDSDEVAPGNQNDGLLDIGAPGAAFGNIYFDGSLVINDNTFLSAAQNSIAIGPGALNATTGGANHVAIGNGAGPDIGFNNLQGTVAIGYNARVQYSGAVAIGNGALVTGDNSVAIGDGAVVNTDNSVRIGNAETGVIGGAVNWSAVSDSRFKTDVQEDVSGLDFINALRPVSYRFDRQKIRKVTGEARTGKDTEDISEKTMGFMAQEVQQLIDDQGYVFTGVKKPRNKRDHYSIRYAEFVVPLTKAVQELSSMVEVLQQENALLRQRVDVLEGISAPHTNDTTASTVSNTQAKTTAESFLLHQNVPNPFNSTTTIKAIVPEGIQQAKIVVYNLQGLELESYNINKRGNVSLEITAGRFPSGMYLYALMADGQLIDTKKMILTR